MLCTFSGLLPEPRRWGGGGRVASRGGGGQVGVTICEKSPAESALTIEMDKLQEMVALCHAV
jgi:hypothetical protein